MRVTHDWTDASATIAVEGLQRTVHMLHVTDTHCALIDERDEQHVDVRASAQACQRFSHGAGALAKLLDPVNLGFCDLVAMTGDIVHMPSQAAMEHVGSLVDALGVPLLYTCGNHDWCFPGAPATAKERETRWPLLAALHGGPPAAYMQQIGNLQFLCIDNSTYQIQDEQLAFVRAVLATDLPTVLLCHIPLTLPTLRGEVIEHFQAPIVMGDPDWDTASRAHWNTTVDQPATLAFVREVSRAKNLVATFCGHVHFPHVDAISPQAAQYVGGPGFDGPSRQVVFVPL